MKKRILTVFVLLCAFAQGAMADKWDGQTLTKPEYTGYSYYITKAAELAYVRSHFSESTGLTAPSDPKRWCEAEYDLRTDIELSDWDAMGNNGGDPVEFSGKFRGNGYTIKLLSWRDGENYQGLFARIGWKGRVENVKITGAIRLDKARLVGGIAGENLGTIFNCWVAADVSSGWHESWSAYTAKVGGIAGENFGTIEFCLVSGNVKNDDADVGGLVGYNKGDVVHCAFYGTRISSHSQHSIYFGDVNGDSKATDVHGEDLFDDSVLHNHLQNNGGYSVNLYAKGVQEPFTITARNWGTVYVSVSAQTSRGNKTITVSYPEGAIVSSVAIQDLDGNGLKYDFDESKRTYTFQMPKRDVIIYSTINYPEITLWSDQDNSEELSERNGKPTDVTLDRKFYHDDNWSTLCLPFAVTNLSATPLANATVQELTGASIEGGTLTLTFSPVTSIEAGKPYIMKWKSGRNNNKPKFWGVTPVSAEPIPVSFGGVTFVGQYSGFNITSDNIDDIILLSEKNTLGYSAAPRLLGACRAHFVVPAAAKSRAITKVIIK